MEKIKQKYQNLTKALATLDKALTTFNLLKKEGKSYNPHIDFQEEYRTHRDSVIQRFEYSEELFWKYLQIYLKEVLAIIDIHGPKPVIRKSFSLELLNEPEAEKSLEMIKDRNLSSHIYIEAIAEHLASKIPGYYHLMHEVTQKLVPKT